MSSCMTWGRRVLLSRTLVFSPVRRERAARWSPRSLSGPWLPLSCLIPAETYSAPLWARRVWTRGPLGGDGKDKLGGWNSDARLRRDCSHLVGTKPSSDTVACTEPLEPKLLISPMSNHGPGLWRGGEKVRGIWGLEHIKQLRHHIHLISC